MEVKHFIACAESVRILPMDPPRLVLHDVKYSYILPPGDEFPHVIEKICLFTRFYGATGTHRFVLQIRWQEAEAESIVLRESASTPLEFDAEVYVKDHVFALYEIRVPSAGLLEFHLTRSDEPEIILASEYFEVKSR